MLKIFVMYIVINIVNNFLIKAFSFMILQKRVKQELHYQHINGAIRRI